MQLIVCFFFSVIFAVETGEGHRLVVITTFNYYKSHLSVTAALMSPMSHLRQCDTLSVAYHIDAGSHDFV